MHAAARVAGMSGHAGGRQWGTISPQHTRLNGNEPHRLGHVDRSDLSWAIYIFDLAIRLGLCFRVIMRGLPVGVSLSWLVFLVLVPFFPGVVYLLIGEKNRMGIRRSTRYDMATRRIEEEALGHWKQSNLDWTTTDPMYEPLARLGTSVGGIPPLRGNALELLGTGSSVLERLIQDIDSSKHHCHLLYYIWMPSGRGAKVGEALIRAVQRGVKCRVLADGVGATKFLSSDLCTRMRAAGVHVVKALPIDAVRLLISRLDIRNHRKIAVIDGDIAYCGSQNLTDETFKHKKHRKTGPWIDATLRIRGPAVQALQTVFLRDWVLDSEEDIGAVGPYFPDSSAVAVGESVVHVLPSGPGPQPDAIHQAMLAMLFGAREEIIMTTPYFVPDEATMAGLINAALRGVDVTLIFPDVLDAQVVAAAARAHYDELLKAGVKIAHHVDGLLHAKTMTIDRHMCMVSSANFDVRSFWLNFEVTMFIYDEEFTNVVRFMQRHYAGETEPITREAWRRRPLWHRFVDNCARLLSPLL